MRPPLPSAPFWEGSTFDAVSPKPFFFSSATSLHAMAGGVASDAVKAIYLHNTGFGSPQAYYASLRRSNAKLGTLQLSYCVWGGALPSLR